MNDGEAADYSVSRQHATAATGTVDAVALARVAAGAGAIWTHQSDDLNVNLLVFPEDQGVGSHVNSEVDVLLVGIAGEGEVEIDGTRHSVRPGQALVIPKGARRRTRALSDSFAYLSCHRCRAGLWPQNPRPNAEGATGS